MISTILTFLLGVILGTMFPAFWTRLWEQTKQSPAYEKITTTVQGWFKK